ncbi:MAG: hypothetical protein HQL87_17800, partial [Magnetococcales bacterium]|nr:hypothetical protein [Magnetococcales bacterium]
TTTGAQTYRDDTATLNGSYTTTDGGANGTFGVTGDTTLAGAVTVTTGSGGVTFTGMVNGGQTLQLTSGNVTFTGAVGSGTPLGAINIVSAHDVTESAGITAASLTQQTGSGTTTLTGAVNTNAVDGIVLTGTNLLVKSAMTTTHGGSVTINESGTATWAPGGGSQSVITTDGGKVTLKSTMTLSNNSITIATNGGDINFSKIIAQNHSVQGDVKLLAGVPAHGASPLINDIAGLRQTYPQISGGGKINGYLDVWNAILTGSGGKLTGSIYRTLGEFKYLDMSHQAAAETIYASPVPFGVITLNGFPIPGYGKPTTKPGDYDNATRGFDVFIPNRTSASDWVLDTSEHPVIYKAMEDWKERTRLKWEDRYKHSQHFEETRNFFKGIFDKGMERTNQHVITIGAGEYETNDKRRKYWKSIGKTPEKGVGAILDQAGTLQYNIVPMILNKNELDETDCREKSGKCIPDWSHIMSALEGFSDAVGTRTDKHLNR